MMNLARAFAWLALAAQAGIAINNMIVLACRALNLCLQYRCAGSVPILDRKSHSIRPKHNPRPGRRYAAPNRGQRRPGKPRGNFAPLRRGQYGLCHRRYGGGTGTGAAPVIARALRDKNILTVGVVTKPFQFEGMKRAAFAEDGIANMTEAVDTLIVIPNQNLFRLADERTTFADAFKMADNVLLDGVQCQI